MIITELHLFIIIVIIVFFSLFKITRSTSDSKKENFTSSENDYYSKWKSK